MHHVQRQFPFLPEIATEIFKLLNEITDYPHY